MHDFIDLVMDLTAGRTCKCKLEFAICEKRRDREERISFKSGLSSIFLDNVSSRILNSSCWTTRGLLGLVRS
jgi:hypothetical protein